jgi:hypothetical protein
VPGTSANGNASARLREIAATVERGGRIEADDAAVLWHHADDEELKRLAQLVRARFHRPDRATYMVMRIINYTNVCVAQCDYCAFYVLPNQAGGGWVADPPNVSMCSRNLFVAQGLPRARPFSGVGSVGAGSGTPHENHRCSTTSLRPAGLRPYACPRSPAARSSPPAGAETGVGAAEGPRDPRQARPC